MESLAQILSRTALTRESESSTRSEPAPDCGVCLDEGYYHARYSLLETGRAWLAHMGQRQQALEEQKATSPGASDRLQGQLDKLNTYVARGFYGGHGVAIPCEFCQEERERKTKARAVALFNALPEEYSGMSFEAHKPHPGTESVVEALKAFAGGERPNVLVVSGPYGTGKTHLLVAVMQRLTEQLELSRHRFVTELLQSLRDGYRDETYDALIAGYCAQGILGLDDLGAGKETPSEWSVEQMELIINSRYEKGPPLIVTTNLSPKQMMDKWGARIADRLYDRVTGKAQQVFIPSDTPSYRTGRRSA